MRDEVRHPSPVYPRKRTREKQSAVLESCAATDVISRGQGKKGRVRGLPGNPPFFSLFLFFLLNLSETVRKFSETKGKARGLACTVRGLFFVFLFLPPSVSPS